MSKGIDRPHYPSEYTPDTNLIKRIKTLEEKMDKINNCLDSLAKTLGYRPEKDYTEQEARLRRAEEQCSHLEKELSNNQQYEKFYIEEKDKNTDLTKKLMKKEEELSILNAKLLPKEIPPDQIVTFDGLTTIQELKTEYGYVQKGFKNFVGDIIRLGNFEETLQDEKRKAIFTILVDRMLNVNPVAFRESNQIAIISELASTLGLNRDDVQQRFERLLQSCNTNMLKIISYKDRQRILPAFCDAEVGEKFLEDNHEAYPKISEDENQSIAASLMPGLTLGGQRIVTPIVLLNKTGV